MERDENFCHCYRRDSIFVVFVELAFLYIIRCNINVKKKAPRTTRSREHKIELVRFFLDISIFNGNKRVFDFLKIHYFYYEYVVSSHTELCRSFYTR